MIMGIAMSIVVQNDNSRIVSFPLYVLIICGTVMSSTVFTIGSYIYIKYENYSIITSVISVFS